MNEESLLSLAIQCLEDIAKSSQRLTTGNVSHIGRNIQNTAASMSKYLKEKAQKDK